jgi:hypothetical protein
MNNCTLCACSRFALTALDAAAAAPRGAMPQLCTCGHLSKDHSHRRGFCRPQLCACNQFTPASPICPCGHHYDRHIITRADCAQCNCAAFVFHPYTVPATPPTGPVMVAVPAPPSSRDLLPPGLRFL